MTSETKSLSSSLLLPAGGHKKSSSGGSPLRFLFVAGGIFVCFFYYGILQEAITKGSYVSEEGGTAERFTYTLSLVFVQCAVNFAYAQILLTTVQRPKGSDGVVSSGLYAICALTYLLAMVSSNLSLQWVPYPTQVVGKSCKPIPVMLLGVLLGGKSYSLRKYLFILLIVVGVSLFLYNPKKASLATTTSSSASSSSTGELLLLMSLAMDGLTGAVQERMRGGPSSGKPNSATMMKFMNLFSLGYLAVALVTTGELFAFVSFVARFPSVFWKILSFSVTSALGQYFIFACVSEFGPLPCSVVTTTRKFFTVLASVFFFGNVLSGAQWGGALLVFVGLSLDAVFKH